MHCVVGAFFGFYKHIMNINLHIFTSQGLEHPSHHPLISWPCVFQVKRHYVVAVQPLGYDEGCFLCVRRVHRNLVISGDGVQKKKKMPCSTVASII